jgi:ERCC4-related helicase
LLRLDGLDRSVVFTRFRNRAEYVAERIEQELGYEVLLMVGGITEKKQKELLDRFADPLNRNLVAVCVYGTISEGVNELVASRDILLLDWYTAKDAAQAVDRLDRPGTKHDIVRATVLYAEGTIDELMIDRSSMRVLPIKEVLRTPDAYAFLLDPIDSYSEA